MSNLKSNSKWIASAGGPCIIIQSSDLFKWSGTGDINFVKEGEFREADDFMDFTQAHYGLACDNDHDYLTKIEVDDFSNLVLVVGDEPLQMKFTPTSENGVFYLVKWCYGESEEEFEEYMQISNLEQLTGWEDHFQFEVKHEEFVLMDAAICGLDLKLSNVLDSEDFLRFNIPLGLYSLSTITYDPDEDTQMLIHRFKIV